MQAELELTLWVSFVPQIQLVRDPHWEEHETMGESWIRWWPCLGRPEEPR